MHKQIIPNGLILSYILSIKKNKDLNNIKNPLLN